MTVTGRVTHVLRCGLCLWTEHCWAPYPPPLQAWTLNTAWHSCAARWQPRLASEKHFRCHQISQKTILKRAYHLHTRHCEPTNSMQVYRIPVPMHLNNLWIKEKKVTKCADQNYSLPGHSPFHLLISDVSFSHRRLKKILQKIHCTTSCIVNHELKGRKRRLSSNISTTTFLLMGSGA